MAYLKANIKNGGPASETETEACSWTWFFSMIFMTIGNTVSSWEGQWCHWAISEHIVLFGKDNDETELDITKEMAAILKENFKMNNNKVRANSKYKLP